MNRFSVIAPSDIPSASRLTARTDSAALAGGVDLLDLLKQDLIAPANLVNLKGLNGLDQIKALDTGRLEIGALVKLNAIASDPTIRERFPALSDAAGEAATPQIRNIATAGGNLLQRPRCWYFRNPDVRCLKKGGDRCYAVGGLNRYHAILGGGPSFIVHPSNLAPALVAYDATIKLIGPNGDRAVAIGDFFTLPKADPTRENVLAPGEIITHITIPAPAAGTRGVYLEIREKQSFDWPLASVAAVLTVDHSRTVKTARIAMGAVAPIPWRALAAEKTITGSVLTPARAAQAAEAVLADAVPLGDNGYKVPIAKTLVRRAILRAGGINEESA